MYRTSGKDAASRKLPMFTRPTATEAVNGYPRVSAHAVYKCHRYERRTVPCFGPSCSLCLLSVPMDNRIYIPLIAASNAKLEILDLPSSFHLQLTRFEKEASPLNECRIVAAREKPFDNARIVLRFCKLSDAERPASLIADFDDLLDAMMRKNVQFWHDHSGSAK